MVTVDMANLGDAHSAHQFQDQRCKKRIFGLASKKGKKGQVFGQMP